MQRVGNVHFDKHESRIGLSVKVCPLLDKSPVVCLCLHSPGVLLTILWDSQKPWESGDCVGAGGEALKGLHERSLIHNPVMSIERLSLSCREISKKSIIIQSKHANKLG